MSDVEYTITGRVKKNNIPLQNVPMLPAPDPDQVTYYHLSDTLNVGGVVFMRELVAPKNTSSISFKLTHHSYKAADGWSLKVDLDNYGDDERPIRCTIYMTKGDNLNRFSANCFCLLRDRRDFTRDVEYYADKRIVQLLHTEVDTGLITGNLPEDGLWDTHELPKKVRLILSNYHGSVRAKLLTPRCIKAVGEVRVVSESWPYAPEVANKQENIAKMFKSARQTLKPRNLKLPR